MPKRDIGRLGFKIQERGLGVPSACSVRLMSDVRSNAAVSREDFDLPDRTTANPLPTPLLTSFLSGGTTAPNDCKSIDLHLQSRFFAECSAALDYGHPNDISHQNRGTGNLRQGRGHRHADVDRRAGIRTFHHTLENPIAAQDLCTWLELLIDFAGTGLLQIKAIVNVAELPGPVLLHGAQKKFSAPLTLTQWPTGDCRTRIALVTRNLNEECLRELLSILTAASAHGRSQAPAIQPQLDRTAGRP